MFIFGMIVGAVVVAVAWVLTQWWRNRKSQIKQKVVDTINKV